MLLVTAKPDKVAQATAQFQELVDKNPENAVWRFNLGRALAAKGDADGARCAFQDAISKRADLKRSRNRLNNLI